MKTISRRELLPGAATAAAAMTIVPRHVLGGTGQKAPSDTLNLAAVGVGGVGASYLKGVDSQNIVALCDVDHEYAAPTFATYPQAKRYKDFRRMLEKEKGVDGVVIATPDHSHAVIAMAAIQAGKHVYCAKPMTRTIHEARVVTKAAREAKVATQMSVQSCSSDEACLTEEWVQSGVIGKVREVHVWTGRPIWPQGVRRPKQTPPVPSNLDWDVWIGPAPYRPYHPAYHPWIWRGWWDFGTGAIGDMGCHTLHVIVKALKLGHPKAISATSSAVIHGYRVRKGGKTISRPEPVSFPESAPHASIITWQFPARKRQPAVQVTWYDGGLKPPRPPELDPGRALGSGGLLFVGDKGTILSGFTGGPKLLPESRNARFHPPKKRIPRSIGHYQEWIEASKGGQPANCEFGFGSFLTEIALLGNLAVRTGKYLEWDADQMKITNDAGANAFIEEPYRAGWLL